MADLTPRRWASMTWPELHAALAGGGEVGLVPLGAIEQHGPHLPLTTDAIWATAMCERASAASGARVLPTLNVGCSFGHGADFPGTSERRSRRSLPHIRGAAGLSLLFRLT